MAKDLDIDAVASLILAVNNSKQKARSGIRDPRWDAPAAGARGKIRGKDVLLAVRVESSGVRRMANKLKGELDHSAQKAVIEAHNEVLKLLTEIAVRTYEKGHAQTVARTAARSKAVVDAGGEAFVRPATSGALLAALRDSGMSDNTFSGFTYGSAKFLNSSANGARSYWRNLETGSKTFLKRPVLITNSGTQHDLRDISKHATKTGKLGIKQRLVSASKVNYLLERGRATIIRNPIPKYGFLRAGKDFLASPAGKDYVREQYILAFGHYQMDYIVEFANRNKRLPDRSGQ